MKGNCRQNNQDGDEPCGGHLDNACKLGAKTGNHDSLEELDKNSLAEYLDSLGSSQVLSHH